MKTRITILTISVFLAINAYSQTYYNMWRGEGDSGKPEWIANLALRADNTSGIEFTTSDACRGFVNGTGRWGLLKPGSSMTPQSLSNIINGISNLTLGVEGWVCSEGISVRSLWDGVTNTLDLLTTNNRSTITSNGDSEGLFIKSSGGRKITLQNDVYIGDTYKLWLKQGRNNDPSILNPHDKWLRIGGKSGIFFWGNDQADMDDNPTMSIVGNIVRIGIGNNIRADLMSKYSLFVKKGVLAEDLAIAPAASWADFVFDKEYSLKTLPEVETFIGQNGHLPDVPSAQEVAKKGYSQHEVNKALLQKVEELTLYIIEQNKRIEQLENQLK